jgi:putative DNA primase/helicase
LRRIANYRDDEGALLAPVTDDDDKLVKLMVIHVTPDGKKSPHEPSRITISGARRPGLFRLGSPGPRVIEVESVEKALAARAAGESFVVAAGGVSNLGKAPLPVVVRTDIIARDDDPPGSPADQELWRGVVRRLGQDLEVRVTPRPNDIAPKDSPELKDLDDVYRYDPELVPELLKDATLDHGRRSEATIDAIYAETLRLSPGALSHARDGLIKLLRISKGALDAELERRIKARKETKIEETDLPGQALTYPPVNPWPDPVDGAELLTEISATLPQYVRLSNAEYDAVALGVVHLQAFDFFDVVPIVTISSPQHRSGKTRLMRLAARVSPKALFISGNTAAFLVRAIDRDHPNIFADEFDAVTKGDPEKAEAMRAHLNALFDREGSYVGKCVPTENGREPRRFSVWSSLWLAGLKKPPTTIEDRAIQIQPKRKLPGDKVKPLRLSDGPEFYVFRRKAARFAIDNERALRNANPSCPDGLAEHSDRAADAWSPLFAIAHVAGGGWLERAHRAALVLSGLQDAAGSRGEAATDTDDELALLVDIRTILLAIDALAPEAKDLGTDKQIAVKALNTARELADAGKESDKPPKVTPAIGGEQLANALGSPALFPDRKWSEWRHGRAIKSHHIVAVLREYGILSKSVRLPDGKFMWGFSRDALDDAFSRYVPFPSSSSSAHSPGGQKSSQSSHSTENVEENAKNANPHGSTHGSHHQ